MRTPGRCTNFEGCWISASHRDVWLAVGEDFACPNCGGLLSPPLAGTRSFAGVKRAVSIAAMASLGFAAVAAGAAKWQVMWPALPNFAHVPQAPVAQATPAQPVTPRPSHPAMAATSALATTPPNARARLRARHALMAATVLPSSAAARQGPLMLYKADQDAPVASGGSGHPDPARHTGRVARAKGATIAPRPVSHTALSPHAPAARQAALPITFGAPRAPETDGEPVSLAWRSHTAAKARTGFLSGPGSAPAQDGADSALGSLVN